MRMFFALIGVAKVRMGIDLDKTQRPIQCALNTHYRPIGGAVLTSQCYGNFTCDYGIFCARGKAFHHHRQFPVTIHRRACKYPGPAWFITGP